MHTHRFKNILKKLNNGNVKQKYIIDAHFLKNCNNYNFVDTYYLLFIK